MGRESNNDMPNALKQGDSIFTACNLICLNIHDNTQRERERGEDQDER